ncbi:hypothetical protein B0H17DRAFT_202054 [Mycena rosella]|uniref:Uncharacterized protein n=1 Tax=Mycena rosella TaxID=1033263 RepID=A0AAD7CYM9_MYCRO|nr:hypothetical protein B0H17DRAFT_202054 [Mycena rosella]
MAANDMDLGLVEQILKTTVRLINGGVETDEILRPNHRLSFLAEIYRFCRNLPRFEGWVNLALLALSVARVPPNRLFGVQAHIDVDLGWVDDILEHIQCSREWHKWDEKTCSSIENLLQVFLCTKQALQPTEMALRAIIQSLSLSHSVARLAFHILHRLTTQTEFLHNFNSWRIMAEEAFWPLVGQLARKSPDHLGDAYFEMGYTLSGISHWIPIISDDLASWIEVFYNRPPELQNSGREKFNLVLSRVWAADSTGPQSENAVVRTSGLVLTSLTHVWKEFDFRELDNTRSLLILVKCTVSMIIRIYYQPSGSTVVPYNGETALVQHGLKGLDVGLGEALGEAANNARNMITEEASVAIPRERIDFYAAAITVLVQIRYQVRSKVRNAMSGGVGNWKQIEEELWKYIDVLEKSQEAMYLAQ